MEHEARQAACYFLDIAALPELGELDLKMPPRRRAALCSLLRQEDRLRCKAGWLLLDGILGARAWQMRYGRYGKPFLPGGPYFNLAHAGDYVILAVAPAPVGADVEAARAGGDCAALAAVALHPHERQLFANHPEARVFYGLWTLKESYLKLVGMGLGVDPASFALSRIHGEWRLAGRPELRFRLYDQLRGHSVGICLYDCPPPRRLIPVQL